MVNSLWICSTLVLASVLDQTYSAEIVIKSKCNFPVWIEASSNPGKPQLPAVTRLNTGESFTYRIDKGPGWGGRFWPKTGCDDSGNNCAFGQSSPPCPSGGCQPPADTKAEFFFGPNFEGDSWYDISLVDGYSLSMDIEPRSQGGSCVKTTCRLPLSSCPTNENNGLGNLQVNKDGNVVACLSPCKKWNYPAPYGQGNSESNSPGREMCCPTPPLTPEACSAGPVVSTEYVKLIRSQCPSAYSYAYDDKAALHNCPGDTSYDITICPDGSNPSPPGGNGGTSVPQPPCTEWGWRFYDNHDIQGNDIAAIPASDRNACQPLCRANPQCRAYTFATWDNTCYLKSGGSSFPANDALYSAVMC